MFSIKYGRYDTWCDRKDSVGKAALPMRAKSMRGRCSHPKQARIKSLHSTGISHTHTATHHLHSIRVAQATVLYSTYASYHDRQAILEMFLRLLLALCLLPLCLQIQVGLVPQMVSGTGSKYRHGPLSDHEDSSCQHVTSAKSLIFPTHKWGCSFVPTVANFGIYK